MDNTSVEHESKGSSPTATENDVSSHDDTPAVLPPSDTTTKSSPPVTPVGEVRHTETNVAMETSGIRERTEKPYAGMGRDDLLRFSQTPFWNRLRLVCLVTFWLGWLALLVTVIVLTIVMPRCKAPPSTDWWQKSLIYDVYVKSFYDTNNDGVGDIEGVERKLAYIAGLNVDTIVLSGVYKSTPGPDSDFGYEVVDFMNVDDRVGTLDDVRSLVTAAHDKGLRVLLDFVPNHTSNQHPWFLASRASTNRSTNPLWNYYVWDTCSPYNPPSNWRSVYGGSAWTFDTERGQCYYHNFLDSQPELNLRSAQVLQELKEILRFWIAEVDIDGFRVNSVSFLVEDFDLRDEPLSGDCPGSSAGYDCLNHIYTRAQEENYDLVTKWRTVLEERSSERYRVLLTDSRDTVNATLRYYGTTGLNGAHLPINYQLTNLRAGCGGRCVQNLIEAWRSGMPSGATADWLTGNADIGRVNAAFSPEYTPAVHILTLTLPGTAFNYYGDELGMRNGNITMLPVDPAGHINSNFSRDPYRAPMQWSDDVNGGFSNTTNGTWLPLNDDVTQTNVKAQEADGKSTLKIFQETASLHKNEESLHFGNFIYSLVDEDVISYVREYEGRDRFLVAINFGTKTVTADYSATHSLIPAEAEVVVTTTDYELGSQVSLRSVTLRPAEGVIFKWEYSR